MSGQPTFGASIAAKMRTCVHPEMHMYGQSAVEIWIPGANERKEKTCRPRKSMLNIQCMSGL